MIDEEGCETGEDYLSLTEESLAPVKGAIRRTLLKYMQPRRTETVDAQGTAMNPQSPNSGTTTTLLSSPGGTMSQGAEKAIIKLAAGTMKVPKFKGAADKAGLAQLHEWIDEVIEAKQKDLQEAGIIDALNMIKERAGEPLSTITTKLSKMTIEAAVDIDTKIEFRRVMPDLLDEKVKDKHPTTGTGYILDIQEALIKRD